MAKIPLRKYDQEIESLIDQNQYDQAIANARHVLKYFPKHLATYRLLGKAYLESQRYGDAADIFQRVLSALPDDFVSHVGLSIIREDEGNLDDAIWHMERAFEVQPANGAIQAELRRLYGRRDGIEPAKVRLTRAALARMYMKGELYPQAIAELRTALNEDPDRPDLLNLLAQAYFVNGQRVEAANICSQLMTKVPNCYEANHILADVLSNTERSNESETYRQRIYSMDPYAAHTSDSAPAPDRVPETAVVVEKMVWAPGQSFSGSLSQPEWAASLGMNVAGEQEGREELPDWLASPQDEDVLHDNITAQFSRDKSVVQNPPNPEDQIPEWMKAAGWQPSTSDEEIPVPLETGEFTTDEDLAPAEIPDWLQAIAPDQSDVSAGIITTEDVKNPDEAEPPSTLPSPPQPDTDELPEWLAGAVAAARTSVPAPTDEKSDAAYQDEIAVEPFNVEEVDQTQTDLPPTGTSQDEDDAFAWLESLAARQGAKEALFIPPEERSETPPDWVVKAASKETSEELPEWLQEYEQPVEIEPIPGEVIEISEVLSTVDDSALEPSLQDEKEIPEWLEEYSIDERSTDAQEADMQEWLPFASQETGGKFQSEELPASAISDINQLDAESTTLSKELPGWLTQLGPVAEEPTFQMDDITSDSLESSLPPAEIPDWLREIAPSQPEFHADENVEQVIEQESTYGEEGGSSQLPDWLREVEIKQSQEIIPSLYDESGDEMLFVPGIFAIERQKSQQLPGEPEILEEDTKPTHIKVAPALEQTEIIREEPVSIEEQIELAQASELPDWLRELAPDAVEDVSTESIPTESTLFTEGDVSTPVLDDEAAFAWLEGLAAKQGTEEALFSESEEQLETPTDWAQEAFQVEDEVTWISSDQSEIQADTRETLPEIIEELPVEPEVSFLDTGLALEQPEGLYETGETFEGEAEPVVDKLAEEQIPELPAWLAEVEEPITVSDESVWVPPLEEIVDQGQDLFESETAESPTLLDLNQAGLIDLERLPGVGFIRAQAIIEHRNAYGPFANMDDLANVSGIDIWTIEQMRRYVEVPPVATAPATFDEEADHQIILIQARNALSQNDINHATDLYDQIIVSEEFLPDIIHDLKEALHQFPIDVKLWSTLGDAYVRSGNLEEAVDAYSKAEELLS